MPMGGSWISPNHEFAKRGFLRTRFVDVVADQGLTKALATTSPRRCVWHGRCLKSLQNKETTMAPNASTLDLHGLTRYVLEQQRRDDGFVEFVFSLGDPSLGVELVLPLAAYEAFCDEHQVVRIGDEQARALAADAQKWRYGKPGQPAA
jgi:phenol/toluene 2-monooxygenase (NADH) P0/A0